jgi:hypothetical protein
MEWTIGRGKPKEQTTGTIFVIRIIFDHLTGGDRLTDFLDTDMTHNTLVCGVLRKFELAIAYLRPNVAQNVHLMPLSWHRSA